VVEEEERTKTRDGKRKRVTPEVAVHRERCMARLKGTIIDPGKRGSGGCLRCIGGFVSPIGGDGRIGGAQSRRRGIGRGEVGLVPRDDDVEVQRYLGTYLFHHNVSSSSLQLHLILFNTLQSPLDSSTEANITLDRENRPQSSPHRPRPTASLASFQMGGGPRHPPPTPHPTTKPRTTTTTTRIDPGTCICTRIDISHRQHPHRPPYQPRLDPWSWKS
jgi:hypothetical protein